MPSKFAEFELPKGAEGLRTDKEGYAAMEQAGRRVGQLYGQAGSDYAAIGRLEDEAFRAQDFPLDFAAFSSGSTRSAGAGAGGGGENFKVSGDINSFFSGGRGASGGSSGSSRGAGGGSTRSSDDNREADRSGRAAARFVDGWGNDISKEANGTTVMRGGRHPSITGGDVSPKDVGQGGLTDPFSPAFRDAAGQNTPGFSSVPGVTSTPIGPTDGYNWSTQGPGVSLDQLPTSNLGQSDNPNGSLYTPSASGGGGGVGQFFSDMWSSVTSAVGSAGVSGVDSDAEIQ